MCRWFAYISATEPCLLEDVLITPKHALAQQVHEHYLPRLLAHDHTTSEEDDMKARNMLFNIDGLGIAWYTSTKADFQLPNGSGSELVAEGLRPAMYKTVQPPLNDMNFRSICANTESQVLFAHIRAASGTAITPVNNHPFIFGRHTFMHNGVVSDFTRIRRSLCTHMSEAAYANIQGGTDSEHLAALYMTFLTSCSTVEAAPTIHTGTDAFERTYPPEAMQAAMHQTLSLVLQLQREILGDGSERNPNSLNLCATDGISLVAYRCRNHATSQPPSLYYSTKAGTTLNRKYPDHPDGMDMPGAATGKPQGEHGSHLIVASEPSTYKMEDWELIGKNRLLLARPDGTFAIGDIPWSDGWDAKA